MREHLRPLEPQYTVVVPVSLQIVHSCAVPRANCVYLIIVECGWMLNVLSHRGIVEV